MSSPNAFASFSIFKGDITTQDFMHLVRESDGSVVGWIDQNGAPQGTLATGGGGGTSIFVNSVLVPNPNFLSGAGINLQVVGSNVSVINTGVTSINSLLGAVSLTQGSGITITPSGNSLIFSASGGAPGTSNVPWQDIQTYGGAPIVQGGTSTTTATTVATSPNITVGSAIFANGNGITIWKAGAATSQSTPSAPTASVRGITGSATVNYKIVGFDVKGGLTAASSNLAVTTAPAIFGNLPVAISAATLTSDVVTLTFSSPINAIANQTIHVVGITGSGVGWCGVFTVASAPTTSSVTYALTAANGTGTVTNATGRISNVQLISSISRASTGIVTINTQQNHNWAVGSLVIIENVTPSDLNGYYIINTCSGTTAATYPIGNLVVENGVISSVAPQSTATVYESIVLACPALSGTTIGYYIYSDSATGSMALIGKTLYLESHFVDYGPCLLSGYVAPAYVPTTPPASAQNQMFTSTVLSGGGTTSLVLNANVPTSISALGATAMHDDGPALLAALAVGPCYLSPSTSEAAGPGDSNYYYYSFNSPITLPANSFVMLGTAPVINETWNCTNQGVSILAPFNSPMAQNPSFGLRSYVPMFGLASPWVLGGNSFNLKNVVCTSSCNGQNAVMITGTYTEVSDCAFEVGENATSIPLIYNGGTATALLRNNTYSGSSIFGDGPVPGQGCFIPLLPTVCFRASDNPALLGYPPNMIKFDGMHTFGSRGILMDGTYFTNGTAFQYDFGDSLWMQAPVCPTISFYNGTYSGIRLRGVLNDSEPTAILGNFANLIDVIIDNCAQGESQPVVTGNACKGLKFDGYFGSQAQTVDFVMDTYGACNIAGTTQAGNSGVLQSKPLALGANGCIFQKVSIAAPTLATTGAGTFPAGSHTVQLSYIGLDGNETAAGAAAVINVNGSQNIAVTFTAPVGFAGVYVYIDQRRQNGFQTSVATFTSNFSGDPGPTVDATGSVFMGNSMIVTPELILSVGGAPATASSTGTTGQIGWDSTHIYICVATNTWVRATLATF